MASIPMIVTTVVGTGQQGFEGDDSSATNAKLDGPQSKNGDLYVTTKAKHVVLKFEFNKEEGTWSNVTIIAGTRSSGEGADDIVGTKCTQWSTRALTDRKFKR